MAKAKHVGRRRGRVRGVRISPGHFDVLEIRSLLASTADITAPPGIAEKVGHVLAFLSQDYANQEAALGLATGVSTGQVGPATVSKPSAPKPYRPSPGQPNGSGLEISGDRVGVEAVSNGDTADRLRSELVGLGMEVKGQFGRVVSGLLPIGALEALAELPDLRFAQPAYRPFLSAVTTVGVVDDLAVQALRSDAGSARYGVDGTGVTVGVLSDSFNALGTYADDVASGDLPANVKVLQELPDDPSQGYTGTDEGRAMVQLVHKVAPGASLAFNSAYYDVAAFAQGIINLAKPVSQGGAGAKVIVDDVGYENEPIFQDGIVAQAIDQVVTQDGVSYFSASGNSGRAAYQSAFRATTRATEPVPGVGAGVFHNFATDGSTDIFQPISVASGSLVDITFQWDQPFASQSTGAVGRAGSASSVSFYLVDSTKSTVVESSTDNVVGQDPFQNIQFLAPGDPGSTDQYYVLIKSDSGPLPGKMEYIALGAGNGSVTIDNYATDTGAEFGHAQAAHAAGVGAVNFAMTPAFNMPAQLEGFSSAGGTALLFDAAGNRLATPDLRQSPRFASVDGTDTTFFGDATLSPNGLPSFSGTSAAAPHAAAVAALLKQAVPSLTPDQIYSALEQTAIPVDGATGFNFDSGYGLIQADRALAHVAGASISGEVYSDLNGNGKPDPGEPGVAGASVYLDNNASTSAVAGSMTKSNTTALTIPAELDLTKGPTRVASPINVSGASGRVTKVTVKLDITEEEDSSLGATLISPNGIRIPLFENTGLFESNFNEITLDDSATTSIDEAADLSTAGTYAPEGKLATMIGEDPNGTWNLELRDFGASGSDGTLNSWSLSISYADPATTTDPQGRYALSQIFQDANGDPITGLAPSSYYGPYDIITTPTGGQSLTQPTTPYSLSLALGQQAAAVDFGIGMRQKQLVVNAFAATSTGFRASFNAPFNLAPLHLYSTAAANLGPADVTVVGATTGPVFGSLIVSLDDQSINFVKTGGVLAPDTYTVTLRSGANGFEDTSGNLLAGDGTPGHNYTATFNVAPSTARVISIPDFARGPGQPVNVPATASGLPLTVSDGSGLTTIRLTLSYNTALLTITAAKLGAAAPAGATVTLDTSTPGSAVLSFTSPTALPAGLDNFATLTASVPASAPYRSKEALVIGGLTLNGGAIAATDGDGVHVVAYVGDTAGLGFYNSQDVTLIRRYLVGVDTGFAAFPLLDPAVVGDVAGLGYINSQDASLLLRYLVGQAVPQVPAVPNLTVVSGGPDPRVWIPRDLVGAPGSTLTVPILFRQTNGTAIGLDAASLAIEFDPGLFIVDAVRSGDLTRGFALTASFDNATGLILASARSAGALTLEPGVEGTLLLVDLTIRPGASLGTERVNLLGDVRVGSGVFSTSLNDGHLTLTPAPTDSDLDPVDGLVTIAGNPSTLPIPVGPASIPVDVPSLSIEANVIDRPTAGLRPKTSGQTSMVDRAIESILAESRLGRFEAFDLASTPSSSPKFLIPGMNSEPPVEVAPSAESLVNPARRRAGATSLIRP